VIKTVAARLNPASGSSLQKRWPRGDIHSLVAEAVAGFAPGATTLPLTRFTDLTVFPVVVWDHDGLSVRRELHAQPILDEETVARLVDSPADDDPPAPLTIHGFVCVAAPAMSLKTLSGLRALGRTIAGVHSSDDLSVELLTRFDLQGTAVVSLDRGELVVPGDPGPAVGSRYDPFWQRVRVEQLYSLALEVDGQLW
jgi:hypothetical protein